MSNDFLLQSLSLSLHSCSNYTQRNSFLKLFTVTLTQLHEVVLYISYFDEIKANI